MIRKPLALAVCASCGGVNDLARHYLAPSLPDRLKAPSVLLCLDCRARVRAHLEYVRMKPAKAAAAARRRQAVPVVVTAAQKPEADAAAVLLAIQELRDAGERTFQGPSLSNGMETGPRIGVE